MDNEVNAFMIGLCGHPLQRIESERTKIIEEFYVVCQNTRPMVIVSLVVRWTIFIHLLIIL